MNSPQYDVIVVGAGAAGLTAAIGLARSGFRVAVVEAADFPGAENWSGCVYFCENLAHPEILGPGGIEALAWERRVVERGFYTSDGYGLLGMTYRDPGAFRNCYTVLRPIYDQHLGQVALQLGVALLAETTAESLIREDHRVVGVSTNRGALYADLVFLAEGDASQLVTREGYERFDDQRTMPKFLQGIKQVIDMPEGAIEEIFEVGPDEGIAYEMLLRNGTLRGKPVHLNMGGFVYTNRRSLSVGLVLPADNLQEGFGGDPNLLMEWFENLPAVAPWFGVGKRGVFGAKIIRGGGARDIPILIDEGLAIGGAASAIGIDFPYPNFTGPATGMGLLIAQAARNIRTEARGTQGAFTRERLRQHYLEPLQRTNYWNDVEFLRRWPGYVKKTHTFFARDLDLALGTAYVWTRPRRWLATRWSNWIRLLMHVAGPTHWNELREDARHLTRALRVRDVADRPALGRLLLDGTVNALRDLFRKPRANLPPAGSLRFRYSVAGGTEPSAPASPMLQRWFRRFAPVLASAARKMYANDLVPLEQKLPAITRLLAKQVNLLDLLAAGFLGMAALVSAFFVAGWDRFLGLFGKRGVSKSPRGLYRRYTDAVRKTTDLTPVAAPAAQHWEARLARLAYHTEKTSHIHVLWPRVLQDKDAVSKAGLWHVCPAHVYEARVSPLKQLQVVVNFENCIKCETCWRTSDLVDWGRDGRHRFVYPVSSPAVARLIQAAQDAAPARPASPIVADRWQAVAQSVADLLRHAPERGGNGQDFDTLGELQLLLDKIEVKVRAFDEALGEEPRTVDRARAEYFEMLSRYVQQLCNRFVEDLRESALGESTQPGRSAAYQVLLKLATALAAKAEERARHTWDQRYSWAAGDGRQMVQHHVTGLRRLLDVFSKHATGPRAAAVDPARAWLRAEQSTDAVRDKLSEWSARLDAAFPQGIWRELDRHTPLTSEQDAVLRDLVAQVPRLDPANLGETLHPPLRKALLAELGRRDPSLAFRVASHLWARDLARVASGSASLERAAERWARGDEWACFASLSASRGPGERQALFVPALDAASVLLLWDDRLGLLATKESGARIEPLATLGLRGAGLSSISILDERLPSEDVPVDRDRVRRVWSIVSAADLTSIASGMAAQMCERAIGHATSRVQFPGLFHDEESRDAIGKFGAVKKMVAEMGARRYLIETLDHNLSPADFSSASLATAGLVKALTAEALGSSPGSLSYNAGQVFGGTGYSEDDILSKFYRDAAAWRYLGPTNAEIYGEHGRHLLHEWRPDAETLARLPEEVQLVEQVVQRKALQAELDEIRNLRSRLRMLLAEWQSSGSSSSGNDGVAPATQVAESMARQDAHFLASKALLLRTHARLENGLPAEVQTALVRVWLQGAAACLDEFEALVRPNPIVHRDDRPVVEPAEGPLVTSYADFLAQPAPYNSGDFLVTPVNLLQPRYVPEMNEADPVLAERDRQFRELLMGHFGGLRDGLIYERYIERQHRPDQEDLDFCRQHGFFRMPIPKELGGEGRQKADYYLLTTNAQRHVDVAISLTIQANTSIGTTPVLLGRDKDLPKAQKEMSPFLADTALQASVRSQLEQLLQLFEPPQPSRIEQGYLKLQKDLEASVLSRGALRVLAHRFTESWQAAGRAGKNFELDAMRGHLKEALAAWKDACSRAAEFRDELTRRREACDQFLQWVASGQISAFALTEPSAGSDTARVATRARLRSVPLTKGSDGTWTFVPAGGQEPRILLDARRLEFRSAEAYYRWSDTAEPASIRFDEYDYETDDPTKTRYFEADGRRVHFTDIAQLRERAGKQWYDYWELTGAKMWITNGRMSGIMALYAKLEEGVTGFIVDRHAEGLIVGKDEAKMGQLGSPTNELSLQSVRVPRENVIGLEGRGQVNALETLNVGRAGLGMSAMAQMRGLIDASRAFAEKNDASIPDWVDWRLQRMEEERFIAEAVAHEVIGRFEHAQTKSVRMESAIAKMVASELLHSVIELAEDVHGIAGQTQLHLVEKRKRDARILNIYEGTNEVQRFTILKDLAGEVAPRWAKGSSAPLHAGSEAVQLEHLKRGFRQRVDAALALFGQGLWQNPNLQANCFLLAEAAAWLKAADSSLGRLAWLSRKTAEDDGDASPKMMIGRRAVARCYAQVGDRLRRFDEELTHLRRGYYAPEVRAASLLFDRSGEPETAPAELHSRITRPVKILVVLEPSVGGVPEIHINDGQLFEPHLGLGEAGRSALEAALRIRDQEPSRVSVEIAAVAPKHAAQALREALSLGIDRIRLIAPDSEAVTADSAAAALASMLGGVSGFDLILGGEGSGEEGLVARLLAAALGVAHAGSAGQIAIEATPSEGTVLLTSGDGSQRRTRAVPAAVAITAGLPLREFTVEGYIAGLAKTVDIQRWPKKVPARPVWFEAGAQAGEPSMASEAITSLSVDEAAARLLSTLGAGGARGGHGHFDGAIEDVNTPTLLEPAAPSSASVLAVLGSDGQGRLHASAGGVLKAAQAAAETFQATVKVLLVAPTDEAIQRRLLGQLFESYRGDAVLLAAPTAGDSDEVNSRLLQECWPALSNEPRAVIGEPWTESAFAALAEKRKPTPEIALRVRSMHRQDGHIVVETSRQRGKLHLRQKLDGGACWIAFSAEMETEAAPHISGGPSGGVQRWSPRLERFYASGEIQQLLQELKKETGTVRLADADFIVDVGYGVVNRDGYEEVIEPLEKALRQLGVRSLVVGGSRKVTEELHLLPVDRQIGQSGVSVNPQILLAIGVSGAPQHLNYIGPRATIVAFNRDPEAPIMTLNQRQPKPRVFPVVGDLFQTVPALVAALQKEDSSQPEPASPTAGSHA
jgi:alkylation response protein AidB-like acyl-CoA dehydrogenase/flavin-dependent dehydrogenase/ferredoxin-like protein FixX